MKNKTYKKMLVMTVSAFFLLLVFTGLSVTGVDTNKLKLSTNTIEVYPGQSIQEAIDSASSGDTIYVHSGTYEETIVIDKDRLILEGENKQDTTIQGVDGEEGEYSGDSSVTIEANNVKITGFTITHTDIVQGIQACIEIMNNKIGTKIQGNIITCPKIYDGFGILIGDRCDDTKILDNKITKCCTAINSGLSEAFKNIDICGNTLSENGNGIEFHKTDENSRRIENPRICGNLIENNNGDGIYIRNMYGVESGNTFCQIGGNTIINNGDEDEQYGPYYGLYINKLTLREGEKGPEIIDNLIENTENGYGLLLSGSKYQITGNTIKENSIAGLSIYNSDYSNIYHNNLIDNELDLLIGPFCEENTWDDGVDGNYWSDYRTKYPDAKYDTTSGPEGYATTWNTPYETYVGLDNHPWIEPDGVEVKSKSKDVFFSNFFDFIQIFLKNLHFFF